MDLYHRFPPDVRRFFFRYFRSPSARIVHAARSPHGMLMEDIRDFPKSLQILYKHHRKKRPWRTDNCRSLPSRSALLNFLWGEAGLMFGDFYEIWRRLYRVRSRGQAASWVRAHNVTSGERGVKILWALFTVNERKRILSIMKARAQG